MRGAAIAEAASGGGQGAFAEAARSDCVATTKTGTPRFARRARHLAWSGSKPAAGSTSSSATSQSSVARVGGVAHRDVERLRAGVEARRVQQQDLRVVAGDDAEQLRARRLRLRCDDRDLLAEQPVQQRRLAGVRKPEQRDDAAAVRRCRAVPVGASLVNCAPPDRDSAASAAARSAARLVRPRPAPAGLAAEPDLDHEARLVVLDAAVRHRAVARRRAAIGVRPLLEARLRIGRERIASRGSAARRRAAARAP